MRDSLVGKESHSPAGRFRQLSKIAFGFSKVSSPFTMIGVRDLHVSIVRSTALTFLRPQQSMAAALQLRRAVDES